MLLNSAGTAVTTKDIYYIPANNTVRVTAENTELAPCLLSSTNVTTLDGSDAAISNTVYPYIVTTPSADSVEVISVRYYKNDTLIYDIANNSDIRVLIQVANTTDISYNALPYLITVNGDENRILKEGTLEIDRDSTESIVFELGEMTLGANEEVVVVF